MPITPAQTAQAEQHEWQAARDPADAIRLIAGPGTGKSATIERRVAHVLNNGSNASRVYVISFTRATCGELGVRISAFCAMQPCASVAAHIRTSTMHSLALRILRSANVLATLYPADPMVLDDWERSNVYDRELANALVCTPGCQSASKFDPRSASNFDPLERRVLTVALAPPELVGVAETARARIVG